VDYIGHWTTLIYFHLLCAFDMQSVALKIHLNFKTLIEGSISQKDKEEEDNQGMNQIFLSETELTNMFVLTSEKHTCLQQKCIEYVHLKL